MKIKMTIYRATKVLIAVVIILTGFSASAREKKGIVPSQGGGTVGQQNTAQKMAAVCPNPTAATDLDINNVRAKILGASDMWWDLINPKYEIPKGTNKTSLYAGGLWIGGIDGSGIVKVAGQTYRQTGNDFWTGPIDTNDITTDVIVCNAFDKHFVNTREDVLSYIGDKTSVLPGPASTIRNWPGNGDPQYNHGFYLAPFHDENANGVYEPDNTPPDYPKFNFEGTYSALVPGYDQLVCNDYLFGDKNLWWVFNDVGNIHGETGSDKIGLEVRAQAFGFFTDDEINNMTFYKYQIINRGGTTLNQTYFGQWVDPDLGNAVDDYVGCDVKRGLGYVYNGDDNDDGVTGYGTKPPACGVDFFQGPLADAGDGIDNDKDGCLDCTFLDSGATVVSVPDVVLREQIIMAKFVYYNNVNNAPDGNPNGFTDFYNYLRGVWLDNIPLTYGGNGRDPSNPLCNYMFPDDTDSALNASDGPWTEVTAGNQPEDRRFIQSAGTFTLLPGAVNYVTTGVVWAQANQLGVPPGIALMKQADDKAQALFDNCFKLIDGPDAPDLVIRELNNQLLFSLQNTDTTAVEGYSQIDPTIVGVPDDAKKYNFQGYKIYQLKDWSITVGDLENPDRARLIRQYDIRDTVTDLVNYTFDQSMGANIPVLKVSGQNLGISHSFLVTTDAFASGDPKLVNNKTLYFMAVSYAYNEFKKYDQSDPNKLDGQKRPYLQGRNNVKVYSAIAHYTTPENGGTYIQSAYGSVPKIKRVDGQGNGGNILDFMPEVENEIMSSPDYRSYYPVYQENHGPIAAKVYDPMLVRGGNYETRFLGVAATDLWIMQNLTPPNNGIDTADRPLSVQYEQLIPEWGISADIHTVSDPGTAGAINNGFLEGEMVFADNAFQWLTGLQDIDANSPVNWIRSGTSAAAPVDVPGDEGQVYESVINGTWAPFKLTSADPGGPKWNGPGIETVTKLSNIASVDIVITSDKSKWSRAAVVETDDLQIGIGTPPPPKCDLRKSPSVDKNGVANFPSVDNDDFAFGMGWFPGYAINLETGERLNIAFGENSALPGENGADMIWNPTSNIADFSNNAVFGGMHYVYVMGHNGDLATDAPWYDGCKFMHRFLDSAAVTNISSLRRNVWKDAMWVTIPLTVPGKITPLPNEMMVPPVDVRIRLRVAKSYKSYTCKTTAKQTLLPNTQYIVVDNTITLSGSSTPLAVGTVFTTDAVNLTFIGTGAAVTPITQNNYLPYYTFNMDNYIPLLNNATAASDALYQINVVPNPYYATSGYEGTLDITGQVDNRIRITNLPSKCTISIFTTNGTLIRQFKRDESPDNTREGIGLENSNTSQDWDLKNVKGISIASGIYLIHVEVPGVGERVIKWFGVIRPVDLDTF